MNAIQCFWLEETGRARRYLRRYARTNQDCPITGYHNGMVAIDEVPAGRKPWEHGDFIVCDYGGADNLDAFKGDARWPAACACGYSFLDTDRWQIFFDQIMRRTDTGEELTLCDAPPGAMWDAWWYGSSTFCVSPHRPDDIHLMLKTPSGDWFVDGISRRGGYWTRGGDPKASPPTVTANPSILIEPYHGWLRDGKLVPA